MRPSMQLIAIVFLLLSAGPSFAVDPQEQLKDPVLEARAREISAGLRCLVCQNQSIDDSDAPLAKDLRLLVRQQLKKGESNEQVIDYVVARYGEFVLLNPRFHLSTMLLWLAPILLVAGGIGLASRVLRRPQAGSVDAGASSQPLTAEENAELETLLSGPKREPTAK